MNTSNSKSKSKRIFKSKIDAWLLAVLALSFIISLFAVFTTANRDDWVISISILIASLGFVVWLFASTRYVVSNDLLLIKSGPFSWSIPLSDITSVEETRNPLSSPALSLDRIEIKYNGKSILVSPADKDEFRFAIGQSQAPK